MNIGTRMVLRPKPVKKVARAPKNGVIMTRATKSRKRTT
jgi:hypothetical protein